MLKPQNDYILVEPIERKTEDSGPIMPDSAKALAEAVVIDCGPLLCILTTFEKGMSVQMNKDDLYPELCTGCKVLYRKMAEDRTTADAAYRTNEEGKFFLLIKISDIVAVIE